MESKAQFINGLEQRIRARDEWNSRVDNHNIFQNLTNELDKLSIPDQVRDEGILERVA